MTKIFRELKRRLTTTTTLVTPDNSREMKVYADVSSQGLEYILVQNGIVIKFESYLQVF